MADGEINRNGATVRIDDNGGVQVEPAAGQEVEYTGPDRGTEAIRESVNTEKLPNEQYPALIGPNGGKTHYFPSEEGSMDAAIQAAYDDAPDYSKVVIPPGSHDANIKLTTNKVGVTVEGAGKQTTFINGLNDHAIEINGDNSYRAEIRNLAVKTTPGGGNTAHGIYAYGNQGNIHLSNLRVTESDSDAYHLACPEVSVSMCSHSGAGDIDDWGVYVDDNLLEWEGGPTRTAEGVAPIAGIKFTSNANLCTMRTDAGVDPVVVVNSQNYTFLDLGVAKGVDLTFGAGSDLCRVDAFRYSSTTNNGNRNKAYSRWDDSFPVNA